MPYNTWLIKLFFSYFILSICFICNGEASTLVKKNEKQLPIVVIDAGHGGKDPGAIGQFSYEKDITLSYAKLLKKVLEQNKNFKVFLTRNEDKYLSLLSRMKKAQKLRADIFISLHADAHENYAMRGVSIYTLSEKASDQEAARIAKSENSVGYTFSNIKAKNHEINEALLALLRRDTSNSSAEFAHLLIKELGKKLKLVNNTHRFAGFKVLKGLDIPAILIELGYLSNDEEELLLHSKDYQLLIVNTIEQALNKYFAKHSKKKLYTAKVS